MRLPKNFHPVGTSKIWMPLASATLHRHHCTASCRRSSSLSSLNDQLAHHKVLRHINKHVAASQPRDLHNKHDHHSNLHSAGRTASRWRKCAILSIPLRPLHNLYDQHAATRHAAPRDMSLRKHGASTGQRQQQQQQQMSLQTHMQQASGLSRDKDKLTCPGLRWWACCEPRPSACP